MMLACAEQSTDNAGLYGAHSLVCFLSMTSHRPAHLLQCMIAPRQQARHRLPVPQVLRVPDHQ